MVSICPSVCLCGQKLGSAGADRAGQGRAAGAGQGGQAKKPGKF